MTGKNQIDQSIVDFARIAATLGVDRSTLPTFSAKAEVPRAEYTGDLDDGEWTILLAQFAPRVSRSADGKKARQAVNALVWLHRTGRALTHVPERYGTVESIRKRVERWAVNGVFDALLVALPTLGFSEARRAELQAVAEREAKRGRHIRALRSSAVQMADRPSRDARR